MSKERTSQTVAGLPPRVASLGGTHDVMRLEELTVISNGVTPSFLHRRSEMRRCDPRRPPLEPRLAHGERSPGAISRLP
jgi:hypothetical protein